MVGVQVCVDDVADALPGVLCSAEIARRVTDRVDDRCGGLPGTSKQVGNGHGIDVQVLAEDHQASPCSRDSTTAGPGGMRRGIDSRAKPSFNNSVE